LTTAHQQEGTVGATFQLNTPHVACEELVGDLILLHFGSGLYYNLRGTAADVYSYNFRLAMYGLCHLLRRRDPPHKVQP
jgi:hypothetical protein